MAKAAKTLCDRCECRIVVGDPFCRSCGYPTTWATHDERTAWEVAQYREKSATMPIAKLAGDAPRKRASTRTEVLERPVAPPREKKTLGGLFGRRRGPAQAIVLPEPKRVEPPAVKDERTPATVLTMVRLESEAAEIKPQAVAPLAPKPTPRVKPRLERPVPARKPAPAPKSDGLVSRVERAMNENEAVVDTPATVLAMRLLNQRVRELDEKVQRLERELEAAKAARS